MTINSSSISNNKNNPFNCLYPGQPRSASIHSYLCECYTTWIWRQMQKT